MERISVIVPVYKVEPYLSCCVNSILNQSYKEFELILIDDGDSGLCGEICDRISSECPNVTVIHKRNGGLSDARNYGIDYSFLRDSQWITFIDSDDYIHPDYLKYLLNANIINGTNMSCCMRKSCITHEEYHDSDELIVSKREVKSFYIDECNKNNAIHICAWGKLYKKSLFESLRYPYGRLHEDAFVTHEILFSQNNLSVVEKELYYYFININGITRQKKTTKQVIDHIDAWLNRLYFFDENNQIEPFNIMVDGVCCEIQRCLYEYNNDINKKIEILKKKSELFEYMKTSCKLYSWDRFIKQYKSNIKTTKEYFGQGAASDYMNMKRERNIFISTAHYLKEMLKIQVYVR